MDAPRVLVVQHVSWEGPHRIGDALVAAGLALDTRCPLAGDALPVHDEVAGAVFMGGPMNVDELDRYPALLPEREWLAAAIASEMPVLGVCLGAQLIAKALGAQVKSGGRKEIGWAPVRVHDAADPILAGLAPESPALHWHGDIFDLPLGSKQLASSAQTEVQAFRIQNAWGLLFHPEAAAALTANWLAEDSMLSEANEVLGANAAERVSADARQFNDQAVAASAPGFAAFAALIATRAGVGSG